MSRFLDLSDEEAFYTYHTLCTYLTGDYRQFRAELGATEEDVRRVASKIETGADGEWLSKSEAHALAEAYSAAYQYTPIEFPFAETRELAEKIYEIAPDTSSEPKYGANWPQKRREVLERDEFKCQNCGMNDEVHQERRGHSLHIHHITPLREFDGPEEANRLENLVALCASCHNKTEADALDISAIV